MTYKLRFRINALYDFFICLLIFLYMMEATSWTSFNNSVIHDAFQLLAIAVAAVYIVVRKYTSKELLRIIVLNAVGFLCFLSSGLSGLFMTMMAITLLPKNSLNHVLKMIFMEEVTIFCAIVLGSQIGLLSNAVVEINKNTYIATARTLGFAHPNMLAAQATSIVLLFLCVKRNRLKKEYFAGAYFSIVLIYFFAHGRTSLLLGMTAVTLIALRKKNWVNKMVLTVLPGVYVFVIAVLIVCMTVYSKNEETAIVKILNDGLFNGRIGLAYTSLLVYPITLFGKQIDTGIWNQWQYYSLDNGQVMILLEYGIAGFLCYFWTVQKTLNQIKKEKEIVFAIIMIVFLVWSMYEGTMYFIGKNFALLFLGTIEFRESSDVKNEVKTI